MLVSDCYGVVLWVKARVQYVIDLKLVGLLGLLFRPRGLLLTTAGAGLLVLLIGQWVNLWRL